MITRRLQAERRTGSVRRPETGVLPTVLRNVYLMFKNKEINKLENVATANALQLKAVQRLANPFPL